MPKLPSKDNVEVASYRSEKLQSAARRPSFLTGGLLLFAAIACILNIILARQFGHIQQLIATWLDPWHSAANDSNQAVQPIFALASGGVLGSGIGLGIPGSIPAPHTTMVIAVIGEELGVLGILGVIALFTLLVLRSYHISR